MKTFFLCLTALTLFTAASFAQKVNVNPVADSYSAPQANLISNGGFSIVSAGANGVLDPGEAVTVSFGATNTGGPGVVCTTAALTGTLQTSGGVTNPSSAQNYGALCSGGPVVFRNFTFTVNPALPCGGTVTASLVMTDGATNYGTLTYTFVTGSLLNSYTEKFDGVAAPALPANWTTTFSGSGTAVTTSTTFPDTAPNDISLLEAAAVALSEVTSPTIAIPATSASRLTFRNLFNTEEGFDGLVLEISINGGAFQDIIAAGGSFVSGEYNSTLDTGFSNPLPGRMAWSGLSGGSEVAPAYITTVVNLPPAATGQNIRLKWRQGSDASEAPPNNAGSRIDTISIAHAVCGGSAPVPTSAVSRKVHGAAGAFNINLPLVALTGAVGIEDRIGAVAGDHQEVVTFAAPVTVGGVSATAGTISAGSFVVSANVVTINLSGVANAQRLGVTLSDVSDGTNLGSVQIPMGVLSGDTNGNGSVNATDVSQAKLQSGQALTGSNFRNDINVNGSINATDVSSVKLRSGTALP